MGPVELDDIKPKSIWEFLLRKHWPSFLVKETCCSSSFVLNPLSKHIFRCSGPGLKWGTWRYIVSISLFADYPHICEIKGKFWGELELDLHWNFENSKDIFFLCFFLVFICLFVLFCFCRNLRWLPFPYWSTLSSRSQWKTQTHTITVIIYCVLNTSRYTKISNYGVRGCTSRRRGCGEVGKAFRSWTPHQTRSCHFFSHFFNRPWGSGREGDDLRDTKR